jgi:hypothetical protein
MDYKRDGFWSRDFGWGGLLQQRRIPDDDALVGKVFIDSCISVMCTIRIGNDYSNVVLGLDNTSTSPHQDPFRGLSPSPAEPDVPEVTASVEVTRDQS